jgi:predicted RNA-binding Zn ribbon-like protein
MPAAAAPGTRPAAVDLATLERVLRELGPDLRLGLAAGSPCHLGPDAPGVWLLPVAISAIELLTSPARSAVACCAGPCCGWLFLDRTRNRNRVWCSMRTCGNRAKARAHYARRRPGGG